MRLQEVTNDCRRSFSDSKFKFVWVTDGGGWTSARRNLETFDVLETMYNITDMENGVFLHYFARVGVGITKLINMTNRDAHGHPYFCLFWYLNAVFLSCYS